MSGNGMTAAAHSQQEIVFSGEPDRVNNVCCPGAPNDERGTPLVHRVVDGALPVSRIHRFQDISVDGHRELFDCRFVNVLPSTI
jgi:hypothetical protein